tara:strand:- start:16288 stop:16671 length:384 start_codon:yes stop_codon:yes gene_type:complete
MSEKEEIGVYPKLSHRLVPPHAADPEQKEKVIFTTVDANGKKFEKEYTPFGKKFDKEGAQKAAINFTGLAKEYFDSLRDNLVKVLTVKDEYGFESELMDHLDKGWVIQGGLTYSPSGFSILIIKNKK